MTTIELMKCIGQVNDSYILSAKDPDIPDVSQKENIEMSKKHGMKGSVRILLIAAIISLLTITAYATDFLHVKSLVTGTWNTYSNYREIDRAMKEAGFQMDAKARFSNGYIFEMIFVNDNSAVDENGEEVLTYNNIAIYYCNNAGYKLVLVAQPDLEEVPHTPSPVVSNRVIGDVQVSYYVDHYKTVPDNYELTEEEKIWEQQPGNYFTYGSDEVEESAVAFLSWVKDGIYYSIMDPDAEESKDTLFSMAAELIKN